MTTTIISCILNTTDPTADLGFEVWIDDQKIYDTNHVQAEQLISTKIPEDEGEHELKFILKNKTSAHTTIDSEGNIVSDARLILTDLSFDEIKLEHTVTELAVYTHDFNGTQSEIRDEFYGEMGCNGTVSLKFSVPIYIWLLEHL